MTDIIRILRVLEYEGPRNWVESAIANRSVKGEKRWSLTNKPDYIIRESIIGETPTLLTSETPATAPRGHSRKENEATVVLRPLTGTSGAPYVVVKSVSNDPLPGGLVTDEEAGVLSVLLGSKLFIRGLND